MTSTDQSRLDAETSKRPQSGVGEIEETDHHQTRRTAGVAGFLWGLATVAVTAIGGLVPLISNPRFYFYDDTAAGAFGIWFEIGQKLRAGVWPIFSSQGWAAGNYAAEGQWGIWNPLIMLVGLLANSASNVVVFSTILKIVTLMILALGTYLLARGYGAVRPLASVAGVTVTLAGFTTYMDASSWVTGLMVFALLPWAWWAVRRSVERSKNPIAAIIAAYLLITIGYVHGTIMLAIVMLGLLVEAALLRKYKELLRVLFFGVIFGLFALAVYLPGVLTASVTARATDISNTGFLTTDLTGLASSGLASSTPQIIGWWGVFSPVPMLYIAWFLPLGALVMLDKLRLNWRRFSALFFTLTVALMLVLAPSDMGPLRFPVRLMPYVALTVIVLVCVLLSSCRVAVPTRGRLLAVGGLWATGLYLAFGQNPQKIRLHLIFAALSLIGLLATIWVLYSRRLPRRLLSRSRIRLLPRARVRAAAVVVLAVCLLTAVGQKHYFTAAPLPDFKMPDQVSGYSKQLDHVPGMAFTVGDPTRLGPSIWNSTLSANSWYMSHALVQNLYSPIMFRTYNQDLCMDAHGRTCQNAADSLFTEDPATGKLLVDLLSIDTVQILRDSQDVDGSKLAARQVPSGWIEVSRTHDYLLWERKDPMKNTGEAVWTSAGTSVSTESNSSQRLVLKVDKTNTAGGTIVLSRLAWPGYQASGATFEKPTRDYLLTLNVPAGSEGKEIVVSFEPPGWSTVVVSIIVGLALGLGWSTLWAFRHRRRLLSSEALEAN